MTKLQTSECAWSQNTIGFLQNCRYGCTVSDTERNCVQVVRVILELVRTQVLCIRLMKSYLRSCIKCDQLPVGKSKVETPYILL